MGRGGAGLGGERVSALSLHHAYDLSFVSLEDFIDSKNGLLSE